MKTVKPILFGLLYGVFEDRDRWIHDDCTVTEAKLISLHFSYRAARIRTYY